MISMPPTKLTQKQCVEITDMYESGKYLNSTIGMKYGIKSVTVRNVVRKVQA